MMPVPQDLRSPVSFRTLDVWRRRRITLKQQLAAHPNHEWAWLWELRAGLLTYLLKQYDDARQPHRRITRPALENAPPHQAEPRPTTPAPSQIETPPAPNRTPNPPRRLTACQRIPSHRTRPESRTGYP